VAEPTNPTPPEKTDAAIQGDIIDFQQFQNENDGHVQILVLFLINSYGGGLSLLATVSLMEQL
jgi:hypothetical protein